MLARIPIAAQLLALVMLGILATAAAMMVITFSGPPPREPPVRLDEVALALTGDPRAREKFTMVEMADLGPAARGMTERTDLSARLAARIGVPPAQVVVMAEAHEPGRGLRSEPPLPLAREGARDMPPADFLVAQRLAAGGWMTLSKGPDRDFARWQRVTALTIAGVALAIMLLAWLAARRITAPIAALAAAARSSRAGARLALEIPAGPPEVAEAARALHSFQQRSMDLAEQRLAMLRAMAHDIGTPLARLAFRQEQLPDAPREAALRDILTIRQLLADSLLLARGVAGKAGPVDLAALCRSITLREADTGREVTLQADGPAVLNGHAQSLERMVQNLVDNAVRYGGSAHVRLAMRDGEIVLRVADGGPGFPDMAQAELLKPFVRGEVSRNDQTGGSGLGLAIVAQVVAQHGGTITLGDGSGGGGLVVVALPA